MTSSVGDRIREMTAEPRRRELCRESCLEEQRDLKPKNIPIFKDRPGHLNAQLRNQYSDLLLSVLRTIQPGGRVPGAHRVLAGWHRGREQGEAV